MTIRTVLYLEVPKVKYLPNLVFLPLVTKWQRWTELLQSHEVSNVWDWLLEAPQIKSAL